MVNKKVPKTPEGFKTWRNTDLLDALPLDEKTISKRSQMLRTEIKRRLKKGKYKTIHAFIHAKEARK